MGCLVGLCGSISYGNDRQERAEETVAKGGDKPLSVPLDRNHYRYHQDSNVTSLPSALATMLSELDGQRQHQIKLNSSSGGFTGADLRIGDQAQMDALWPSRIVTKMEVTGLR